MSKPSRGEYIAAVLLGHSFGLHTRMAEFWPGANDLDNVDRVGSTIRNQTSVG
jgi:hypothetical protein